jgi:drug/metabolite transporter (DMT)-like permease
LNRWVVRSGGRTDVYGFWISLFGALTAGLMGLALGQNFSNRALLPLGLMVGFAFALGFCLIINYCLKIGPTGPTVAANNLGLVGPVIVGLFWPKSLPISPYMVVGFGLAAIALVTFGLSSYQSKTENPITPRWAFLVFWGWLLAAISMTGQYLGSILVPESSFALVCIFFIASTLILFPFTLRYGKTWFNFMELVGGAANGTIQAVSIFVTQRALQAYPSATVFPVTVLGPLIAVLLLSGLVYRERLSRLTWTACLAGVAGLALLSLRPV